VSAREAAELRAAVDVLADEEWRPAVGFGGYLVSSFGRVFSSRSGGGRLLRGHPGRKGYWRVKLTRDDGPPVDRCVHKMVAEAFHGPCPPGHQVRHLDGNHLNNRARNLAYGTASRNILDQVEHGRHNMASKTHCPQGHPYNEENTYVFGDGARRCVTCRRAQQVSQRRRSVS
jgi:hypothetical protein